MKDIKLIVPFLVILLFVFNSCNDNKTKLTDYADKKVIIVHSYHDTVGGVKKKNKFLLPILESKNINYEILYLDSRRNPEEEKKIASAKKIRDQILEIKPDIIISFDDNAFKYLIMPYFRDSEIPVIFGGIDWDISIYDAPYKNTTGIISVDLVSQLIELLKVYTDGDRVAWLGYSDLTAQKTVNAYNDILDLELDAYFIETQSEWENTVLKIQKEYDIFIINSSIYNIENWDKEASAKFIQENIQIPVGSINSEMIDMTLLELTKHESEIGEWIGETVFQILDGKKVSSIPVTHTKIGNLYVNLNIAKKLDIEVEPSLLKNAQILGP